MTTRTTPVPLPKRDDMVKRLRRIEGQIRGLVSMIEDGRDCADVVNQFAAAKNSFDSAAMHAVLSLAAHCSTPQDGTPTLTDDELRKLAATLA